MHQTFSFILKHNDPNKTLNSVLKSFKASLPSKECQNDSDFFSGDEWSDTNKPSLIFHFKRPENVEKEDTMCFNKDDIIKWIQDPRNLVAKWIPNGKVIYPQEGKSQKFTLEFDNMDSEGYGGRPSFFEHFYKLPVGGYIIPKKLKSSEYIAIPFYTKTRIGNIYGVFGVGSSHGQLPGETIYYLVAKDKDVKKKVIKKFLKTINYSGLNNIFQHKIKNSLSNYNATDIIKFFGGGREYLKFMNKLAKIKDPIIANLYRNLERDLDIDDNNSSALLDLYEASINNQLLGNLFEPFIRKFIKEYLETLSLQVLVDIIIYYNDTNIKVKEYEKPFESDTNAYFQIYEEPSLEPQEESEEEIDDEYLQQALQGVENDDTGEYLELYRDIESDSYNSFINALNATNIDLNKPFKDPFSRNPKLLLLVEAIRPDGEKYVKALLDKGADVNIKDDYGRTPLIHASAINEAGIVKLLLDRGADKSVKDDIGYTAKDYAVLSEVANML